MYLLSNAQKIFTEYEMRALDIANYFDGIFISSEHGVKKPDIRFFEKLLETYGICREQAIMIGNDGICDIEGAKEAVWLRCMSIPIFLRRKTHPMQIICWRRWIRKK